MATETATRLANAVSPVTERALLAEEGTPRMTVEEFRQRLTMTALYVATMGKLDHLRSEHWTPEDMGSDRRHACLFWLNEFMTGDQPLCALEPACYPYLEALWLDELKQHLAFQNSLKSTSCTSSDDVQFYFQACDELRDRLANSNKPAGRPTYQAQYIQNQYFSGGRLGGTETDKLIARKTERLSAPSRHLAERFVGKFYNNIMPAIIGGEPSAIRAVLEALRHGGSAPRESGIVNGFEALVAILCLDGTVVREAAQDTAIWQSTL